MKKVYIFALLLVIATGIKAQVYQWTNTFGGSPSDDISFVIETGVNGHVYVSGTCGSTSVDFDPSTDTAFINSAPGGFSFIAKYKSNGDFVWVKNIGQTNCTYLTLDSLDNIYVTGNFNGSTDIDPGIGTTNIASLGMTDIFLSKYDSSGNLIWGFGIGSIDSELGMEVKLDHSNHVYITGNFSATADFDPSLSMGNITSNGNWDAYLAKYDANGNYLWAIGVGGSNSDGGRSITFDQLNNVYFTGNFFGTADFDSSPGTAILSAMGSSDVFITKYSPAGNFIWVKTLGSTTSEDSQSLTTDNANNIIITGVFTGTIDFDLSTGITNLTPASGSQDLFYAKYDTAFTLLFAHKIGGPDDDRSLSVTTDSSNNIYLTGQFKGSVDFDPGTSATTASAVGSSFDFYIAKYTSAGDFSWVKTAGSTGEDVGQSITVSNTGEVYVSGWFSNTVDFAPGSIVDNHTSNGAKDVFITKYGDTSTGLEPAQAFNARPFIVYPNPANNTLFCETTESTQLSIYNSSGALVFTQSLSTSKHTLDISSLVPGVYLVRFSSTQQGMVLINQ